MKWSVGKIGLAVAMLMVFGQLAEAQRREGRRGGEWGRGGFGVSAVELLSAEEAQEALELSKEQREKLDHITDKLRQERRDLFQRGDGDFRQMREKMQKLNAGASAKAVQILDEQQQSQLAAILVQVNGPAAVAEPPVAKTLSVTDEQKSQLMEIRDDIVQKVREVFQQIRNDEFSRDEARARFEELRSEADTRILAVLSEEQQERLQSLQDQRVDVDLAQFRRFGRRGSPDGRGRRDEERRNRDR